MINIATPRPAVIKIKVATIGWMPITETSAPFHRPRTTATSSETSTAVMTVVTEPGSGESRMIEQASAPAIAPTAPTERSIPRVAITRVIPIATISVGAPLRRMSIRLPNRWPSLISIRKKPGKATMLTTNSTSSSTTGQNSRCEMILIMPSPPRGRRRRR